MTIGRFPSKRLTTISVARQIAADIREAILKGELPAGTKLPGEDEMAEKYGVSSGTIRSALVQLAAIHLVEPVPGARGGTFVRKPGWDDLVGGWTESLELLLDVQGVTLEEIGELRLVLTGLCGQLAAQRREDADLQAMHQALVDMEQATARDALLAAHNLLHDAVATATHNRILAGFARVLHQLLHIKVPVERQDAISQDYYLEHHRQLVQAIECRDAAKAARLFQGHQAWLIPSTGRSQTSSIE